MQLPQTHAVIRLLGFAERAFDCAQLRVAVEHELDRCAIAGASSCDTCAIASCAGMSKLPASGASSPRTSASRLDLPLPFSPVIADLLAAKQAERGAGEQQPLAAAQA